MKNEETVCAVVVTYNRKNLLIECLEALQKQIRPIQAIYLIDNASTDNTPELLLKKGYIKELPSQHLNESWEKEFSISNLTDKNFIKLHYVRMNENTGGAGGFYEGVKRGYKRGYDWLWLMDDDTIPFDNANKELLNSIRISEQKYPEKDVGFALSKVWFNSNEVHLMNIPQLQPIVNGIAFNQIEDCDILFVPSGSFVSMMISKRSVKSCGYPVKEFFIWGDDTEYSSRITNKGFLGIYCKDSNVIHKTKENYSSNIYEDNINNIWKYKYGIKNQLLIIKQDSYLKYLVSFFKNLIYTNIQLLKKRKTNKIEYIRVNTYSTISSLWMKI